MITIVAKKIADIVSIQNWILFDRLFRQYLLCFSDYYFLAVPNGEVGETELISDLIFFKLRLLVKS